MADKVVFKDKVRGMKSEKISIIVPVYKVEEYICECIDSLINQTYQNIEVLLVDDGSPDRCPEICDEYAKKDSRINVIHKENGGVSSARNAGLDAATGDYIAFVDSDDYVDKDYVSKLYKNLNGCRISECGTVCFDEDGMVPLKQKKPIVMGWERYLTETNLEGFLSYAVVYSKLYAKELFSDIRFPIGQANGEDELTAFRLVCKTEKISRIYDPLYFYRQRANGASQNKVSEKRIRDAETLFDEKISYFKSQSRPDLAAFFSAKKAICFVSLRARAENPDLEKYCSNTIKALLPEFMMSRKVPMKYKLYMMYFRISQKL